MLALGDTEVVVSKVVLVDAGGRIGGADGQHGRRPIRTLGAPDLTHTLLHTSACHGLKLSIEALRNT